MLYSCGHEGSREGHWWEAPVICNGEIANVLQIQTFLLGAQSADVMIVQDFANAQSAVDWAVLQVTAFSSKTVHGAATLPDDRQHYQVVGPILPTA